MSVNISQLTAVDSVQSSDLAVVWANSNGDSRKASMSVLKDYMQNNLDFSQSQQYTTQYAAPSASYFSVQIRDDNKSTHLILTQVANYSAGTIVLPTSTNLVDKQEVLVNCTKDVTVLTIDKNGATAITGEPTALTAYDFFRLKYDAPTSTWYRVG